MTTTDYINKNVTIIIRTVGERTTELCYELIKKQIAEENIHIISETPFTEAIRKTFEVGMWENRKWTFVVDADVLLKPGTMKELIDYAETVNKKIFKFEGKVIDRFLDSPREAGTHLYRTKFLKYAIKKVPDPFKAIRPETEVRNLMGKKGFGFIKTNILTGLHDYEQYYRDIYRKSFIQAKKHYERVLKLLTQWEEKSITDLDFKVALTGFKDGANHSGSVSIDINEPAIINEIEKITGLNLTEKGALEDVNWFLRDDTILQLMLRDLTIIAVQLLRDGLTTISE